MFSKIFLKNLPLQDQQQKHVSSTALVMNNNKGIAISARKSTDVILYSRVTQRSKM